MKLRVATFNIRNGDAEDGLNSWRFRKAFLAEFLREFDADLIALQEVMDYQLDYILGEMPEYEHLGVGRIDGASRGEFAPILFRKPLELVEAGHFWLSETPEIPGSASWDTACERICTWAKFENLIVANTHLDHVSALARRRGTELILQRIMGADLIVGDFNSLPSDLPVALIKDSGLRDMCGDSANPTFHDWGRQERDRIDYIFAGRRVRGEGQVVSALTSEGYVSDHHAVVAEIEVD